MTEGELPPGDPLDSFAQPDKLLDGRYLIIRELGRGGFGAVYLASDEKVMSKRVVVKVLHERDTAKGGGIQKFKQEVEALTRVDHPGIVGVLDTGELPSGNPYIVMRYVDGVNLRSFITPEGMALERVARLLRQIGNALTAANEKGILHRDLKPENLMLQTLSGSDEQVTIIDFGVAKIKDSLVAPSTVGPSSIGTYVYMSPEQLRGEKLTATSDIYSLGIIAYELVTGRRPFNPETVGALAEMQRQGVKIAPKDLRPSLPEEAQQVILKALSFEPADRFESARQFGASLEETITRDPPFRERLETARQPISLTTEPIIHSRWGRKPLYAGLAVLLLALVATGIVWKSSRETMPKAVKGSLNTLLVDSVAVLPFGINSTNKDADYISDGITESLIDELSQLPSMKKVIARSSVFRFRDKEVDPHLVGSELNVGAVLFGKITQRGDDFTIRAELVGTSDSRRIWGAEYKLKIGDILAKQKEISRTIATSLQSRISDGDGPQNRISTQDNEAYLLYLKGRYFLNRKTPEMLRMAVDYFQRAIDHDPGYALAYTGLADSLSQIGDSPPSETMPKAKAAALKALAIDGSLAEAHASLALVMLRYEFNWTGAEEEFKRAVALNPNYSTAHQWYAVYLLANKRSDEALIQIKRSEELDPLSVSINTSLGNYYLFTRQYDEAVAQYHKTLELEPNAAVHPYLRVADQEKGNFDEAFKESQMEFAGRFSAEQVEGVKAAYAMSGYKGLLAEELKLEKERTKREYTSAVRLARICAVLDQKDEAFAWLNKAFEAHEDGLIWLKVDPRYDHLKSDPRFAALLQRVGIPQ